MVFGKVARGSKMGHEMTIADHLFTDPHVSSANNVFILSHSLTLMSMKWMEYIRTEGWNKYGVLGKCHIAASTKCGNAQLEISG